MSLTVETHTSLDQVDPAEWDSVVDPDNVPATHRFVRLVQEAGVEEASYQHVLVRRQGRVVAVSTHCLMRPRLDAMALPALQRPARRIREHIPSFMRARVALGGIPASFAQSALGLGEQPDPGAVLLLGEALDQAARSWGARLAAFKELTPREAEALRPLTAHGWLEAPALPTATLHLPARTWEGYLAALRHPYRRQLNNVLKKTHGLTATTRTALEREAEAFYELYEQVLARTEAQLEQLNRRFFSDLSRAFPEDARWVLVHEGPRLVAAGPVLQGPGSLDSLLTGLDYTHPRSHASYHLLMAEMVREALRCGAPTLKLGQTSWPSKTRLGAVVEPRHVFVRGRGPLVHRALGRARGLLFPEVDTGPRRRVFRG